jgi:mono/diheme cytochrome c family protein
MARTTPLILAVGLVVAMQHTALAQDRRGNPAHGRAVAEAMCSECHGRNGVPGLRAIAHVPSTTALSLRVALQTTHTRTKMPNLVLTRRETDDVIAYILSLAGK